VSANDVVASLKSFVALAISAFLLLVEFGILLFNLLLQIGHPFIRRRKTTGTGRGAGGAAKGNEGTEDGKDQNGDSHNYSFEKSSAKSMGDEL